MSGTLAALLIQYKYGILAPLSLLAQPAVGMFAGALARLGYLDVYAVYAILVSAAFLGDITWYWIGARYGEAFAHRFGRYVSITPEHVASARAVFHRYHAPILLVSKITNGFGFAIVTLFTAGLSRVPFAQFVIYNLIGEALWSAMIVGIGYFFGDLYIRIGEAFGSVTLVLLVIAASAAMFGFSRYLNSRLAAKITGT